MDCRIEGEEEATLAGRGPLCGGRANGKSVAIFTDEDLAERYISELGETGRSVPVKFPNHRDFITFLKAIQALGYTHILLDPPGKPIFEGLVMPIDEAMEEDSERSP